jgi:hypothetical protein
MVLTDLPCQTVSSAGGWLAEVLRMKARIGRLWRLARDRVDRVLGEQPRAEEQIGVAYSTIADAPGDQSGLPEQPVLLLPSGNRVVRVGELLPPAPRRRWPLSVVRLPVVPKRAILAAGVCAGLAGPTIVRALATRALLGGSSTTRADGVLEITRIVYDGPLTPRATAAITRAILATRR